MLIVQDAECGDSAGGAGAKGQTRILSCEKFVMDPTKGSLCSPFLITGVPRSGTTFFARIMNGHRDVLCGMERFHGPRLSPERLTLDGFKTLDRERQAAEKHNELVAQKCDHNGLVIGEKNPRAYLNLHSILARFDSGPSPLKVIALFRNIEDIEQSWFRRATDRDDESWERGQYTVFPYIEMVLLVWSLVRMPNPANCLLVSYKTLVTEQQQEGLAKNVAGHLGLAEPAGFLDVMHAEREFTNELGAGTDSKNRGKRHSVFETSSGFFQEIVRLVDRQGTCPLSELQGEFETLLCTLSKDREFFNEVIAFSEAIQDADICTYQEKVWRLYAGSLANIDAKFAVELEAAFKRAPNSQDLTQIGTAGEQLPAQAEQRVQSARARTRYYDFSGLLNFILNTGGITGIQRVQLEAIRGAATSSEEEFSRAAYFDQAYGWRSITLSSFIDMFSDDVAKLDRLRAFRKVAADLPPIDFFDGDILYFLGATWDNAGLFRALPSLRAKGVSCVFYMHDLLPVQSPEYFEQKHNLLFRVWLASCLRNADGLICNSVETRLAILLKTGFRGPITVSDLNILPGFLAQIGDVEDTQVGDVLARHNLNDTPFVLMVGTIEPRKNHLTALEVWRTLSGRLGAKCPCLVIVGKIGWMASAQAVKQIIEADGERIRVVHLTDVDDQDLAILYRKCQFTLFISKCEGWGLPVTEALAAGAPSVVGQNSVALATKQDLVVGVDERSESSIADAVRKLIDNPERLNRLRHEISSKRRLKTWQDFATSLVQIESLLHPGTTASNALPPIAISRAYAFRNDIEIDLKSDEVKAHDLLAGNGWHESGSWGIWARQNCAELAFVLPNDYRYCAFGVVTLSDRHEPTWVWVKSGGEVIWQGLVRPNQRTVFRGCIRADEKNNHSRVSITSGDVLDFSKLSDTPENRNLGVGLIEFRLVPQSDFQQRLDVFEELIAKYVDR